MNKRIQIYLISALSISLFGVFIYPTLYKYDKLDQKYPVKINRITGDTKVLRSTGWVDVDATQSEIEKVRYQVNADFESLKKKMTEDVKASIRNEVVASLQEEIEATKKELEAYKKFETDSDNYFTIGTTKDQVKGIMGPPDRTFINEFGGYEVWYYGFDEVKFKNGKVTEYSNSSKNLRVK